MGYTGVLVFEWDESKRSSNLRKHGLDFADCGAVFARPVTTRVDNRDDYGERRFVTLGLLGARVVNIVHTVSGECVRVISFRRASKREQAQYFKEIQD
jgi:uncharacterized DUF497 family protein